MTLALRGCAPCAAGARSFARLGQLGVLSGGALTSANATIARLTDKLSLLRRDVLDAVAFGTVPRALAVHVDSLESALEALEAQVGGLDASALPSWVTSAQGLERELDALRGDYDAALSDVRRIRTRNAAIGIAVATVIGGGVAYVVWRNRGRIR